MHYVIQENIFKESNYQIVLDALERLKLPHSVIRVFPFVDKIALVKDLPESFNVDDLADYVPAGDNVFAFGAVKLTRIAQKRNWKPGSMMNDNHDFRVYGRHYGNHMLNSDSILCTVKDSLAIRWMPNETRFIRPSRDLKSFTGQVFKELDWLELAQSCAEKATTDLELFNEDTLIQIAAPKEIQKEIRFWIVDGKIVTGSQYRLGGQLLLDSNYDAEAEKFVMDMIQIFQPAQAFVMDACLCDGQWKVIEINCINASGFYKSDVQKLLMAIENCQWN